MEPKKIPDPYHWLEDPDHQETKRFVREQNKLTTKYIRRNRDYASIRKSFLSLSNYTSYGIIDKYGDYYYQFRGSLFQDQSILYRQKSLRDFGGKEAEVFIDPNQFSTDGTVALSFVQFSPDFKWCAYGFSKGGSDWVRIKIKNVATKEDLGEELIKVKFSSLAWNKNSEGFFYAFYDEYEGQAQGTDTLVALNQKLYYHRVNTSQEDDQKIFGFPEHPRWLVGSIHISNDGKTIHLFPSEGTSKSMWLVAEFDPNFSRETKFEFNWIVDRFESLYEYLGDDDDCFYIRTDNQAENFRVVCVDRSCPCEKSWQDVLANSDEYVLRDAVIVNQRYLVALYLIDVVDSMKVFNLSTGRFLYEIHTPIGSIAISSNPYRKSSEFFYKFVTFDKPGIIYRHNLAKSTKSKIFQQSIIEGLDYEVESFETTQKFYRSKDGTIVPMFLFHRKNLKRDGRRPTWLTAYGGFGISIVPHFSTMALFFAKHLDGVFAVANIRGGGEYGEEWHREGMLLNKQNVFDDFASAAKWLINKRYTSRSKLTIEGGSNGGLLMGVSCNQRPDLFGTAIAKVGVMDMLKFPLFTIGYAWIQEYGDPIRNETQFDYISAYSPLHNVPKATKIYPNLLVMTADHDDRVVPGHSYKFISEVQFRLGWHFPYKPFLIRIDSKSGHGFGKSITKRIDVMCLQECRFSVIVMMIDKLVHTIR
ncbi:hypothetical protein NH340_JMT03219 [Sarcoptes scabiei]|nr:hypothetical protein NH340_JMT03219 [Sarcoptes scabiei]